MTDLRTAAQQALETLEALQGGCTDSNDGTVEAITVWCPEVIDALSAALAEPVQEPVAWIHTDPDKRRVKFLEWRENEPGYRGDWIKTPLYAAPPQRKPLTEEEIKQLLFESAGMTVTFSAVDLSLARAVERAHGIGSSDVGT